MSRAWAKGSTSQWRRTRKLVLDANCMDNGCRCTAQLPGCTGLADTTHHIYGRAQTADDLRYLTAVCSACNLAIGDPTKGTDPAVNRTILW